MTPLRKRMLEDLQLRNLSQSTIETYLSLIERFARYYKKSPQQLGAEEVRGYLLHLIQGKKAPSTVIQTRSALRFLYVCTLKQKWFDDEIPHPKKRITLPGVVSVDEVARMLDGTQNLKHWTILATFYATAVRCKELQQLKVSDIDSQRMVLHVRHGKGNVPRDIALSPALLERLRLYFRRCRPQDWLFPSGRNATSPLNARSIRYVFRKAAQRAGIKRRIHPHLFRHYAAFPTMPLLGCGCFVYGLSSFVRGIVRLHRLTLLMNDQQGFHFCKNDRTASTGAFEQVSRCLFGGPVRARL